jgi:hypothetical protein
MEMEGRYVNSGYIIYPKLRYFVGIYELHFVSVRQNVALYDQIALFNAIKWDTM